MTGKSDGSEWRETSGSRQDHKGGVGRGRGEVHTYMDSFEAGLLSSHRRGRCCLVSPFTPSHTPPPPSPHHPAPFINFLHPYIHPSFPQTFQQNFIKLVIFLIFSFSSLFHFLSIFSSSSLFPHLLFLFNLSSFPHFPITFSSANSYALCWL